MKKSLMLLYLLFCISNVIFSQTDNKIEFSGSDFKALKKQIKSCSSDSLCLTVSINKYLDEARRQNDSLNQIRAFKYFIRYAGKIKYIDSVERLVKNPINAAFLPELSIIYFISGGYYYDKRQYDKALTYYLKAKNISDNNTDIDFNIALIKSRLGNYEEALEIFINAKKEFEKKKNKNDYLISLYAISDTYRRIRQLDSATFYTNMGLQKLEEYGKNDLTPYFMLNKAGIDYGRDAYKESYNIIKKIIPDLKKTGDISNLAMCYYFLGMNAKELDFSDELQSSFIKLDSLTLILKDLEPEFRKGYEVLIDHFQRNGEMENELKYIKRLLEVDQILNLKYENLSSRLNKEYDTPALLKEKEKLIFSLKRQKESYVNYIGLCFFIILLMIMWIIYRRQFYKKRIKLLMDDNRDDSLIVKSKGKEPLVLDIKQGVVTKVLNELKAFEEKKGFLDSEIKIVSMADKLETNANYLSKIINYHKGKNFSNYLNDLRIEYCISRMKSEKVFRKYTIKAIAEESGFNSSESFSKAFTKRTGIKPSTFLRELSKRGRNSRIST